MENFGILSEQRDVPALFKDITAKGLNNDSFVTTVRRFP
jgi:hypothetical protein